MKLPPASANATSAPLLRDMATETGMHQFRTTGDLSAVPGGLDLAGLAELRCSASSQFSEPGWPEILRRLAVAPGDLWIVDLRQESHGFLDGHAVSWHAHRNWDCVGLSPEDSARLEELRLRVLADSEQVEIALGHEVRDKYDAVASPGSDVLGFGADRRKQAYCAALASPDLCPTREGRPSRDKRTSRLETETWTVTRVASEREVVEAAGVNYLRIPVTDHLRPTDERIDDFVDFVRGLPRDAHLHFHCHGGEGRTTTFMTLYDMLRNARAVSPSSVLARIRLLSRYCLCFIPPDFHRDYVVERWALFDGFYRYARAEGLGGTRSWSAWLAEQGASGRR